MAHPLGPSLTPPEIAFLCEMELVTVIPRQRLNSLQLLGGPTPPLRPPTRTNLPLWLAILLKRQRRADIAPPSWLHPAVLSETLERETAAPQNLSQDDANPNTVLTAPPYLSANNRSSRVGIGTGTIQTPPFQPTSTATDPTSNTSQSALPYHWLDLSHLLLAYCADDIPDSETVRRLLRDLREVRAAKIRRKVDELNAGAGVKMNGTGAMELGECRSFMVGVVDGLRKVGASKEAAAREEWEEGGGARREAEDSEDEEML